MKSSTLAVAIALSSSLSAQATLPASFTALKAADKQEILFQKASSAPYTNSEMQKHKDPGILDTAKLLSPSYLAKSFTTENDEFEKEKTKVIHTYGAVAKVTFRVTNPNISTGLLSTGAKGIMRMSLAKLSGDYTPGLALKLLVDGQKSQNIFAMFSLDGQGTNNNFFANNFTTKIADPQSGVLKILASKFKQTLVNLGSDHQDPTLQSVTDLSEVTNLGERVALPRAPFSLIFKPTAASQMSATKGDLRTRLGSDQYNKGMILYKVYAVESAGKSPELLGEIELDSKFVASNYGDKILFFQHNID